MEPLRQSTIEVDLRSGDILTMEGLCQKHCVHFVPCDARFTPSSFAEPSEGRAPGEPVVHPREGVRINVTFRWIRNHKLRCRLREAQGPEGMLPLFCEMPALTTQVPPLASSQPPTCAQDWADGKPVTWRSCEGCDHDGWRGGRNCLRHEGFWLCRRCWARAKELGPDGLYELPTDPAAAEERKRLRRQRAMEARSLASTAADGLQQEEGYVAPEGEEEFGELAGQGAAPSTSGADVFGDSWWWPEASTCALGHDGYHSYYDQSSWDTRGLIEHSQQDDPTHVGQQPQEAWTPFTRFQ